MSWRFAIGESHFAKLIRGGYNFVDKSLFIKDVMLNSSSVMLFTRPRRFGKTLNMTMLQEFLDLEGDHLFTGLQVSKDTAFCDKYQNQYPVLFLSLKDCKAIDLHSMHRSFLEVLSQLYEAHDYLLNSPALSSLQKEKFRQVCLKQITDPTDLAYTLSHLTLYIKKHTSKDLVVLLDEYDTPIHSAYMHGFLPPILDFMRILLGSTFKDNRALSKGVMTGITRVAQESLFSGLNNLQVYPLLKEQFSSYFGFTQDDVEMLLGPRTAELLEPVRHWYNGYTFGSQQIYNPWSIISCLQNNGVIEAYWRNTSDNGLIFKLIRDAPFSLRQSLGDLIAGIPQMQTLSDNVAFQYLEHNSQAIWTLLLHTGYLNAIARGHDSHQNPTVTLQIPNREVMTLFHSMIDLWFQLPETNDRAYSAFLMALKDGDVDTFARYISQYIMQSGSFFDFSKNTPEMVFHVFILGILLGYQQNYTITSNREAGTGRADLLMTPKVTAKGCPAIIIEFKAIKDPLQLASQAEFALDQIKKQQYHAGICGPVIAIGLAFCGKEMQYRYTKEL